MSEVKRVIAQVRKRRMENTRTKGESLTPLHTRNESTTITLPWIPGVSPKSRKVYKQAGYKTVFKSGNNLKNTICSKNKTKLPRNSYPGVYIVNCRCNTPYIGETKFKICSRGDQYRKNVIQNKIDYCGTTQHSQKCNKGIEWESLTALKVENNKFDRKVRGALEIQYHECGPKKGGMNLDDGQYVNTKFWTPYFKYLRNRQNDARNADITVPPIDDTITLSSDN